MAVFLYPRGTFARFFEKNKTIWNRKTLPRIKITERTDVKEEEISVSKAEVPSAELSLSLLAQDYLLNKWTLVFLIGSSPGQ